jgi:polysaccharide biosynthesis/export protein
MYSHPQGWEPVPGSIGEAWAVWRLRILVGGLLLGALVAAGGCELMPTSGPQSWDIFAGQHDPQKLHYTLVRVTPQVVATLGEAVPRLATAFANNRPPERIRFGIGDVVSVTIFESAAGGLFIPAEAGVRPGNFITVPSQAVDPDGNISIPYGGAIRAKGRTSVELQRAIVDALANRAIEPQAIVSLVTQQSALVSILGDVRLATRLPALPAGEHLLDTIARAGGPAGQGYDEWVMLERNGRRETVPFGALVYDPADNIYTHPLDTIYLYRQPQTFLAFGGVRTTGAQISFDQWRLSLAEAVSKAGGLVDAQADPGALFLYRGETREVAKRLGVDISGFDGPIIPVIYNINFRDPAGYFLATRFEMRNKDVIYVSNAVSVEVTKFLTYLQTINGTISDPIQTAISVYTLKAAVAGTPPSVFIPSAPGATPSVTVAPSIPAAGTP